MSPSLNATQSKRCAIYTRKSTDAGLHLEANSLISQREVCQAYIRSQAHRNWLELPHLYDDGGYSGGNLQRPAMKRLLADTHTLRCQLSRALVCTLNLTRLLSNS